GALVSLGDLVVQRPLEVVSQGAVQTEAVLQAESFAGDSIVTCAGFVEAETASRVERSPHCTELISVAVGLVVLVGQPQASVVGVVPAQFGQHVGGPHILGVGLGAVQPGTAGLAVGVCCMTITLTQVQKAVELAGAAGYGAGSQPAVVGRAVTGFQARAHV